MVTTTHSSTVLVPRHPPSPEAPSLTLKLPPLPGVVRVLPAIVVPLSSVLTPFLLAILSLVILVLPPRAALEVLTSSEILRASTTEALWAPPSSSATSEIPRPPSSASQVLHSRPSEIGLLKALRATRQLWGVGEVLDILGAVVLPVVVQVHVVFPSLNEV